MVFLQKSVKCKKEYCGTENMAERIFLEKLLEIGFLIIMQETSV